MKTIPLLPPNDSGQTASAPSTALSGALHVSQLQRRVSALVRAIRDGDGPSFSALLATCGHAGWSRNNLQVSSLFSEALPGKASSTPWPRWAIRSGGQYTALTPWGHRTEGTGFFLPDTWPSPRATDGAKGGPNQRGSKGDLMLPSAVQQQWNTPKARDWRTGGSPADQARNSPDLPTQVLQDWRTPAARDGSHGGAAIPEVRLAQGHALGLDDQVRGASGSGSLSPDWVEILQGFPVGWTSPDVPNGALDEWQGWPARPGCEQMPYEPPRTAHKVPHRVQRLRALGNCVVSLQALPLFEAIMSCEQRVLARELG